MRYPALRLDLVRVGLALYGLAGDYPGAERLTQWPALEIQSRVSRVLHLAAGDAVGYGRTYVAPTPRPAALVGIGYGDGFRRALGNRGAVLVRGVRAPVLGRVSMDQIVVDLSAVGAVAPGELVTVLGRQGEAEVSAGQLAAWTETIPYEIVTGLAPRLPRAYLLRGRLVGVSDLLGDHQLAPGAADAIFRWPAVPSTLAGEQELAGGA
jgi:alanine racemase